MCSSWASARSSPTSLRGTPAAAAILVGISLLICVAGLLWAVFDPYRRALHDRIAGTIVVQGV